NGVPLPLDLVRLPLQAPVAQFLEEREEPALARLRRPALGYTLVEPLALVTEGRPQPLQPVPAPADGLAQLLVLREPVVLRLEPAEVGVLIGHALEEVHRQDGPLGLDGLE